MSNQNTPQSAPANRPDSNMSQSGEEYDTRRWDTDGLDASVSDKDEISAFIRWKVAEYAKDQWRDDDLWEMYHDDFKTFTQQHFEQSSSSAVRALRNHLRENGVYGVAKRGTPIARALRMLLEEEEPTEWSEQEIKEQLSKGKFNSCRLNQFPNQFYAPTQPTLISPSPRPEPTQTVEQPRQTQTIEPKILGRSQSATPGIQGYGKELTNLSKSYSDSLRYTGNDDNLDYKLEIFHDLCDRTDIPWEARIKAFPIMLKDRALDFYYHSCKPQIHKATTFEGLSDSVRQYFEGPEHRRNVLQKWNRMNLRFFIDKFPDRSIGQNFEELVTTLRSLQLGLDAKYRDDDCFHDRLLAACQDVDVCRYACYRPSPTLPGLLSDLRSSIDTNEKINRPTSQVFYTDRRYHRSQPRQRRDTERPTRQSRDKPCYVCGEEGCWSTNHSKEERVARKKKLQRRFNKRVDQYLLESDDDDGDAPNSDDSDIEKEVEGLFVSPNSPQPDDSEEGEIFLTSSGTINGVEAVKILQSHATYHSLTKSDKTTDSHENDSSAFSTTSRYTSEIFYGIMIDTGASKRSTAGYSQYLAYKKGNFASGTDSNIDRTKAGAVNVQFGIGSTSSIGTVLVDTPIGRIEFHIVEADTPFLLCLRDMDTLKVQYDNLRNVLVQGKRLVPVIRRFGHPFLLWDDSSMSSFLLDIHCNLSQTELRQLHRRFGHPSANRLYSLLKKSGHEDIDHEAIEKLTKFCQTCQKHGESPRRFKFTLRDDSIDFNHSIYIDVMYINNHPILHVVDEATRFQAARWLRDISSKTTWNALRLCWIDCYVGPPDFIVHDAGKNFVGQEFQQYSVSMAITTKCVPVEAHHSMGIVERYHRPLRRAYEVISEDLPDATKESVLQMAVKAVNDTAGPDGLIPTLLVFGCYPRMVEQDPPAPSIAKRATTIKRASAEVQKLRASRQVAEALRQRNGPQREAVHSLPINSDVLVWRDNGNSQRWEGPFKLLGIENETCRLQLPSGPTDFRTTSVKPYYSEDTATNDNHQPEPSPHPEHSTQPEPDNQPQPNNVRRQPERTRRLPARYRDDLDPEVVEQAIVWLTTETFMTNTVSQAREKELHDLLERTVFVIVDHSDVPKDTRIFGTRWVDTIKNEGTPNAFAKARLVVQAYKDQGKRSVLTQSPTIQRASQRLLLSIAASTLSGSIGLYLRDISQAYVQSLSKITRDFYVRPPPESKLQGKLLKVERPLYGIPEAGNHWFETYQRHHIEKLGMKISAHDNCLLYAKDEFGIVGLQTDDTLILADKAFAEKEEKQLTFSAKPRERLSTEHPLNFNGAVIQLIDEHTISITQERHCDKISLLAPGKGVDKNAYIAQRARGAYIATVCQPEAAFDLSSAAQTTNPTEIDATALNKRLRWQKENRTRGLNFVRINLDFAKIVVFTDSSFANNKDYSSQIGYVVVMTDGKHANIVHWQSIKCKRVTRSVLASELYAMAFGFDQGATIKATTESILNRQVPLIMCTDSRSLYDCLVKLGTTHEKRLMIDIMCLRQSYEQKEISEIRWIDGKKNPADAMTKGKACQALKDLIDTNTVDIEPMEWVER